MRLTPIEVECYAGVKADETPRRFHVEGQTMEADEVLDRWYQVELLPEWPRAIVGSQDHGRFLKNIIVRTLCLVNA